MKDVKFRQNLKAELQKDEVLEEVTEETKFVDPCRDSCKCVFDDVSIDEPLNKQNNDLSSRIEIFPCEGS